MGHVGALALVQLSGQLCYGIQVVVTFLVEHIHVSIQQVGLPLLKLASTLSRMATKISLKAKITNRSRSRSLSTIRHRQSMSFSNPQTSHT